MIKVEHLTKCYGDFTAVSNLSFEIGKGQVYGFLGPNGAGKSTTMNIMTGCLSPTSGTVEIGGFDILSESEKAKSLIGYAPEIPPLYMNETPLEYLTFVGRAKGVKGEALKEQIKDVMEKTGITPVRNKLMSTLSKGYRQRVDIAQALLGDPKVIILDEPTVGLDPIQIIEIRDLIKKLGEDHTVIFSSHILSEVQAICKKVLIISKGKLVAFDEAEKLEKLLTTGESISFSAEATKTEAEEILAGIDGITEWSIEEAEGTVKVNANVSGDARRVCSAVTMAFASREKALFEISTRKANLEDVFIELTEKDGETAAEKESEGEKA